MHNTSTVIVILIALCVLQIIHADISDAESAIQLPRRSAGMYWVNRSMPNKYRKYRTYNAVQSIAPDEKKLYSKQLKIRLANLLRQE